MSDTLVRVQSLVARGAVQISDHGYDELAQDDIFAGEVLAGVSVAVVVEEYPESARGTRVLVLQQDAAGRPIYVVWGLPKNRAASAVMVTAYRPDPTKWSVDFLKRTAR